MQLAFPRVHPQAGRARVLLTSVFGPYAQDDEYGSRAVNPMELYHNQVTRTQGVFSLRMFHRSWGLMMIQANVGAPCTVLDFPTLERFEDELRTERYDVVGISAILPNLKKVQRMCEIIRHHQPQAQIVVGGHIANRRGLEDLIDADHVVRGEGVAWFRRYLGEDLHRPVRHPLISSATRTRALGLEVSVAPEQTAATIIPSVGCPLGCDFCSTSAMFGGKGKFISFYETGDELFEVMRSTEEASRIKAFFLMDENFLLHKRRALRLLELMQEHGKSWALYVFSSASALKMYTMEELVALGVSWVWLGLEGPDSGYGKLKGTDTFTLVRTLQSHGIRVLGSSIVGLPSHTRESLDEVIAHAVAHDTEFHQFMLYTPVPGTPLYERHRAEGNLLSDDECPPEDVHGQLRFNYRHEHLAPGEETRALLHAFEADFDANGPSLIRIARTLLEGWSRHKHHPDARVRERFRRECADLPTVQSGVLWASQRWPGLGPRVKQRIRSLRRAVEAEFGWKARLAAPIYGAFILASMAMESLRLRRGHAYEPSTFYETNLAEVATGRPGAPSLARWVEAPDIGAAVQEAAG